jgi:hypothetical protein
MMRADLSATGAIFTRGSCPSKNPQAMKSALLPFTALLLSGCAAAGHLYPVGGPLASQTPKPVYTVKMEFGDGMSARLGIGKVCRGRWLDVVQEDPTARDMEEAWDLVYGKGYFLANVLGHLGVARAVLKCPEDATLETEFNSVQGVAKDADGNVFKLVF